MILQQIDTLPIKRQMHGLQKKLQQNMRSYRRLMIRSQRNAIRTFKSYYYVTNAVADTRHALALNEDIALAVMLIICAVSFASVSILANVLFTFVSAAYGLAAISSLNLAALTLLALAIMAVLIIWLTAMLQNALAIALLEGANRKRNRSLRATLRAGLRHASRVSHAWILVLATSLVPIGLFGVLAVTGMTLHNDFLTSRALLIGSGTVAVIAMAWALASFTLVPYIVLFEKTSDWLSTFQRSRSLVQTRGKLFIISGYILFALCLGAIYGIGQLVQFGTHLSSTLVFLLLGTVAFTVANGVLTMFYRKRKLARK